LVSKISIPQKAAGRLPFVPRSPNDCGTHKAYLIGRGPPRGDYWPRLHEQCEVSHAVGPLWPGGLR
jgi:hypothetical protein